MKFVNPIKDARKIEALKKYLKERNERDYMLFLLGIHFGLRISDLLSLRIEDVVGKKYIIIKEKKTGKIKSFPVAEVVQRELESYLKGRTKGWLFLSREKSGATPITRQQAYNVLSDAAKAVGIKDPIGTHTLRKTFGYWACKQGTSLELIQKILNHSSPGVTLRYIGITQDQINSVYKKLKFK